jgi:hypothetical protein
MNKTALRHAGHHLHSAKTALARLEKAASFDEIESAWVSFLMESATVFNKLERGSKGNKVSEPWYGRIKNQRRTDPLLRYVHAARNVAEHGIEDVTKRSAGWSVQIGSNVLLRSFSFNALGHPVADVVQLNSKNPAPITYQMPGVQLVDVVDDRFKDTFHVPAFHLGVPVLYPTPREIARLTIDYLAGKLSEAKELAA